jgi:hypothetical protein
VTWLGLICALAFGLVCGIAIGATVVRDLLDGLWSWPRRREPEPSMPPAWLEHWAKLNEPTVRRRRR